MYYLMNKDKVVLSFAGKKDDIIGNMYFEEIQRYSNVPLGFDDIDSWLSGRNAAKHNSHIKKIMVSIDCNDNESYLQITHAASINDTFWVKSDTEDTNWNDVSLYRNQFTEVISKMAFEGIGVDTLFSPTVPKYQTQSPELAVEGSFRRCFKKEKHKGQFGSDIFFYKRGLENGTIDGLQHYCEVLSSEIANRISPQNAVRYSLSEIDGKYASKCNLFSNEDVGLAPLYKVIDKKNPTLRNVFDYYHQLGCEDQFREMMVVDSLCFNIDRHLGNLGVLFNNDTLEILGIAPIYDLNWSLFSSFLIEDLTDEKIFGNKLINEMPKMGDDFTRLGQTFINDDVRKRVTELQDFSFDFRGNNDFSEERIVSLEKIIKRQATALVSGKKEYTKDVFYSSILHDKELLAKKAKTLSTSAISYTAG